MNSAGPTKRSIAHDAGCTGEKVNISEDRLLDSYTICRLTIVSETSKTRDVRFGSSKLKADGLQFCLIMLGKLGSELLNLFIFLADFCLTLLKPFQLLA